MKPVSNLIFFCLLVIIPGCSGNQQIPIYANLSKYKPHIDNYKALVTAGIQYRCLPEFPFKDGWLGADGTVSVPLDATTTLFLFSDTYVGRKNQKSRNKKGLRMVANTAAIQTCSNEDESNIRYYWNMMYSSRPAPIFKPSHNDYKFWVTDAFLLHNNLYVLLENIAPYHDAPPDEIFAFKQIGFTLAKINNPYVAPNTWQIEYTLLPHFKNPEMGLHCHSKHNDYIYFFVSRYDQAIQLVRKKITDFDNQNKPFEYYSLDKTWKKGLDPDDMHSLFKGFRCNTVKYHPDQQVWVMINDIWFMDNKIKMRTASELTGPWSNEKVIYTIPERTQGNKLYHEDNFCYLARECIQNYDAKNKMMLITYDVNNFNMSHVIDHPEVYTPKVIKVPLNLDEP